MDHFDIVRWTDYVRGLVASPEREAMMQHLADGCDPCVRLVGLIQRIDRDSSAEPIVPDHLVRQAKSTFPAHSAAAQIPPWMSLPRLIARLAPENSSGPGLEGARSGPDATAQAVYHAGRYSIEVHVEREPESTDLALVGQVVSRAAAAEPLAGAPVLLMARRKLVVGSECNRFGEFCLTGTAQRGLKLCIGLVQEDRRIEIPLNKIMVDPE